MTRYEIKDNIETKRSGLPGNKDRIVYYYYPEAITLENSVRFPNVCKDRGGIVISDYACTNWDLPGWDKYEGKSLFDPTPRGWRLPYAEECPSEDNFKFMSFSSYTSFYFRLNNSAGNDAANIAIFPKSGFQGAVAGNVPWCGDDGTSAILNQSPTFGLGGRPRCWTIKTENENIIVNGNSDTEAWRSVVTRLIRDHRQD